MNYSCFKCQAVIGDGAPPFTGRRDECPKCRADLHVCMNCEHYDAGAYNGCREPQAERVVDKDRSNFCDYFVFRKGGGTAAVQGSSLSKLDALFKK